MCRGSVGEDAEVIEGQQQALPLQDPRVCLPHARRYPIQYPPCSQSDAGQYQAPPLHVKLEALPPGAGSVRTRMAQLQAAGTMRDYPSTEGGEGPHLRPSHAALESWTERQSHPPALKDLELHRVEGEVEGILLSVVWAPW